MNLTNLKGHLPDNIFNQLNMLINKYDINTPFRLSIFLGQCDHESGGFKVTSENLNYSSDRLLVVFPTHFKGVDVTKYNRNPQMVANRVYANRMGNGDEMSGDGWKFRGRGYIQITGKDNYTKYGDVNNPDRLSSDLALDSAAWFWKVEGLNQLADSGLENISEITKRINGGELGLIHRTSLCNTYYKLLVG